MLEIYTDGSWKDGVGSWSLVIVRSGEIVEEVSGRCRPTTSVRMEFQAAIEALTRIPPGAQATAYSDSRTVVDSIQMADDEFPSRPDRDLTMRLRELNRERRITWRWIRAHAGNPFNERCDAMCDLARSQ